MRPRLLISLAALAVASVVFAGCSTAPQDSWYRSMELVPASDVSSAAYVKPGTVVGSGHRVLLTGFNVDDAQIKTIRPYGRSLIIQLDQDGKDRFTAITTTWTGKHLLFVFDGKVLADAYITETIDTGHFGVPLSPTSGSAPGAVYGFQ